MATLQTISQPSMSQLMEVANHQQANSLSIVLPTHQTGREVEQNSLLFKNLLREAVERLVKRGEPEESVERRLAPLFAREADREFWQHQTAGLALYFSEGEEKAFSLHERPEELAYVADHFFITPVALDEAGRELFTVLTVSWEEAALYRASRNSFEPVESHLFPVLLGDVVLPPDAEEQLQYHTQGSSEGAPMYHGQGEGERMIQSDRLRFLAEVAKRIASASDDRHGRLIVVATDEVAGHLAAVSKLEPYLMVTASPHSLDEHDLRDRVLAVIDATRDDSEIGERLGTALAHRKASRDLEEILRASAEGRVETLLVSPHKRIWGTWDAQSASMSLESASGTSAKSASQCELVNMAVIKTLQTGGDIVPWSDKLSDSSPLAAIFRY